MPVSDEHSRDMGKAQVEINEYGIHTAKNKKPLKKG
jgi:hypothetical protein